jgi:hypothetical protein
MTAARDTHYLELYIASPMQLFNSMDPAPFRERDLDSEVVTYIVDWARQVAPPARLGLQVNLNHAATPEDSGAVLLNAVHEAFRRRAITSRVHLKNLLRSGRISLVIGLTFLASAIFLSDSLSGLINNENYARLLQESVVIGGWVALWHPLNIFLYEWWPIWADIRLYDRLGAMDVRLVNTAVAGA